MILGFCLVFAKGIALPLFHVCQANTLLLNCPSLKWQCSVAPQKFRKLKLGTPLLGMHFPGNQV